MDKFLFVDIDGVLNGTDYDSHNRDLDYPLCDYNPENISLLNDIINTITDLKIVVSSDRRFDIGLSDVFKKVGVLSDIYGITPSSNVCRGYEIEEYLKKIEKPYLYHIIDDNNDYYDFQQCNLTITSKKHGLCREDANNIIDFFKNKLNG